MSYIPAGLNINSQAGTTYTLALTDINGLVTSESASPTVFTVPKHASVALPARILIQIEQRGTGALTIVPEDGTVTVNGATLLLPGQWSTAMLVQTATLDTWDLLITSAVTPTAQIHTPASGPQTVTLACAGRNQHDVTGHADGTAITFAVSNMTNNQCILITLTSGAVAATIAAWPGTTRILGTAPTAPAANKKGSYVLRKTGLATYDLYFGGVEA
jgi:hypothetical protein